MLKKIITYEGLDGQDLTEEFYFHLTKANLIELDMSIPGGFAALIQRVMDANDNQETYELFKKIVLVAVGKKSADGKRFLKSDEIRSDFENTEAFSELVFALIESEDDAAAFLNGLIPRSLAGQLEPTVVPAVPTDNSSREGLVETPFVTEEAPVNNIIRNEFDAQNDGESKVMTQAEAQHLMASDMPEFQQRMQSGWTIQPAGPRVLTQQEVLDMDAAELKSGLATGRYTLG